MEGDTRSIIETRDGSHTLVSEQLQVSYHSRYGAVQESMHVFLSQGLLDVALRKNHINVLEIGFGTGLNVLLTYREAIARDLEVIYYAAEAYPISVEQAAQLNYHPYLGLEDTPDLLTDFHKQAWEKAVAYNSHFSLKKIRSRFEDLILPQNFFDLVYYDAFAPTTQPELWEPDVLKIMFDCLQPGGILVTYSAKGSVKRNLKSLGFEIESLPGPPGKREMTRARKP